MDIVIDSEQDLQSAITRSRDFGASRNFVLRLSDLPPQENRIMQDRMNRHASACGCSSAAAMSLSTTSAYLVHVVRSGIESSGGLIAVVMVSMTLFLLSGALGKIAGVIFSQWQLRRTLTKLLGRVEAVNKCNAAAAN